MWPRGKTIDNAIVIGEKEGGLYKLKGQPEQDLVHDSVEPNEIWHRRLAHVLLDFYHLSNMILGSYLRE